jgi:hypothetical protein
VKIAAWPSVQWQVDPFLASRLQRESERTMQVKLDMEDVNITLGNKGILLTIADNNGGHIGHLRLGQATVEWRKGRTRAGNGKIIKLQDLVNLLDSI